MLRSSPPIKEPVQGVGPVAGSLLQGGGSMGTCGRAVKSVQPGMKGGVCPPCVSGNQIAFDGCLGGGAPVVGGSGV